MLVKLTAALALALAALSPAQAQQSGMPLLPLVYSPVFHAIGRLGDGTFTADQGCTGALIAPDLVLTAAHCVPGRGRGGLTFVAGWSERGETARAAVIRTLRHPDYAPEGTHGPSADLGLAVLATPLETPAPLALFAADQEPPFGTEVAILGYHAGAPQGLSGRFDCALGVAQERIFALPCPVRGGNSGSPLLTQTDGGWQILGVASSRSGRNGTLAPALDAWLHAQLEAHLNGG